MKMRIEVPVYRCISNDDGDGLKLVEKPHHVSKVAGPVASLKGTPVDCLCWCLAEEVASYKSDVIETIYEMYEKRKNIPGFDGKETDLAYTLYKQGIDYLPILIEHAHRQRIDFYASFRMNDTHHKSHPDGPLAPEFWKTHPEYRIWGETDAKSYYNAGMDFSFDEVRNRKFNSISEVARNYAVDGVELDFSRCPYLFQPEEAWEKRGILTKFIMRLRAELDRIGKERGKPVPVMVRTVFSEKALRHAGIDLHTWINEGLCDILVLTDLANTFRADFEPWLSLCRKNGVPFYPAVESATHIDRRNFHDIFTNPDAPPHNYGAPGDFVLRLRAAVQNYLSKDISGIYLFNMPPRPNFCSPPEYLKELYNLLHRDKLYHFWKELPLYVEAMRPAKYHQTIEFPTYGEDIGGPDSRVTISFRQMAVPFPHASVKYHQSSVVPPGLLTYNLNSSDIQESAISRRRQPAGRIPSGFKLKSHELIEFHLPGTALRKGGNKLEFSMPKPPTERDPYVYIFELDVRVRFRDTRRGKRRNDCRR